MKTFFKNIFLFSTVLVVLLGSLLLIMHIIQKNSYKVNYRVENKIKNFTLDSKKLNILIAGDSRAEQQLIPKIFEEQYGYNSFNIATNSCDLVSTVASINKHYVNSKDKILFIISSSSAQINDGAVDFGYLSYIALTKLTLEEKLKLYKGRYVDLFTLIRRNTIEDIVSKFNLNPLSNEVINNKGVKFVDGELQTNLPYTNQELNNHQWYKNISVNGYRKRIFKEAFHILGNMQHQFIIMQPPVSPYFRKAIKGTPIEQMEKEYSLLLGNLAKEFDNIEILDYYINDIKELENNMYYDSQHLNKDGALIFSKLVSKEIKNILMTLNVLYD
tara:strand:- start:187 stop:1176 length:990 start_codon:yes stop_codon:yes gene_type:complete